ncbi:MAG: hypothetical protein AB7F19_01645 [Candidatus Babeliales bacterium]
MEKIPTARIILNDYLVKESVELILKRALEDHCTLYILEEQNNHLASAQIATQFIFKMHNETNQGGTIIVKVENTTMLLSFKSNLPDLLVDITPLSNHWKKTFLNGEYQIDLARYLSLLLLITQDFPIINIEILH